MERRDCFGQSEREGSVYTVHVSSMYAKMSGKLSLPKYVGLNGWVFKWKIHHFVISWYIVSEICQSMSHFDLWFDFFAPPESILCCYFPQLQAELKLTEYHKLARKLKLIPLSAENACGHDFEIRPFECGPSSMVQHKTQIQVLNDSD